MTPSFLFTAAVVVHCLLGIVATWRLRGLSQPAKQLKLQLVLVWLLPFVGALGCLIFVATTRSEPRPVSSEILGGTAGLDGPLRGSSMAARDHED